MTFRRAVLFGLMFALAAPGASSAWAQDDLLAPLAPAPSDPPSTDAAEEETKPRSRTSEKKRKSKKKKKAREQRRAKRQDPSLLLAPLAPTELVVKLEGQVKGAQLTIDGKSRIALPVPAPIALIPGKHRLEVRRPGFATWRRTIELPEAETTTVSIALEPVAAVVNVFADVPGAQVSLDGKGLGAAPVRNLLVEPGKHSLMVTRTGFDTEVSELEVEAGRDYTLNIYLRPAQLASKGDRPERGVDLSPSFTEGSPDDPFSPGAQVSAEPSWYQRWYVWAGVGAVVAAGVAGAVVANQNAAALPPEKVCGGQCGAVINAPGIARF